VSDQESERMLREIAADWPIRTRATKGYEPGNIEFISWRANYLKRNGTLEELEQLVAHMRKVLNK